MEGIMKVNLLAETEEVLREHHLTLKAVKFISNAEGLVEVANFVSTASQTYYDNASGSPIIDPTLIIAGRSWWISRFLGQNGEYWFFHKRPVKPELSSPVFSPTMIRDGSWTTIV